MFQASGFRFYILCFILLLFPILLNAQSLNITSAKTSYNVGDSFLVSIYINTKNIPINTISGTIRVPADKLQITETRYGNSIITLWVSRPNINASAGTISFAGGVPGGYNGSSGPILNFVVKAKATGLANVSLADVNVLLNDGLGTALNDVTLGGLNITINKAPAEPVSLPEKEEEEEAPEEKPEEILILLPDMTEPESFAPIVSRHPSIAENSFFVSFFAVDKDSGIARYEIKEKPLILSYVTTRFDTPWTITESPYIVAHQYLTREIVVRAYDQAGNFREEKVLKPVHSGLLWIFAGFWTLIVVMISYFYFHSHEPKKQKRRKIMV